jgi:hypothetical protein
MADKRPLIDTMVQPGLLKLVESAEPLPNGKMRGRVLKGPFGFTEKPTINGRIYINELWENVMANPEFEYLTSNRLLLGEADHPPGDDLESSVTRTSHFMLGLSLDRKNNVLNGSLEIVPTPCGEIITVLVDHGWTPGVSSRGGGDEIKRDGRLIVDPKNYFYYCHDIVVDPSCGRQARITEGTKASNALKKLVESRYPRYTSADGDYDFFAGLLKKFGVRMAAIRESVGDKSRVYSIPSEEAEPTVLKERINALSEEVRRGVPGESLVKDFVVLKEKYDAVVVRLTEAEEKLKAGEAIGRGKFGGVASGSRRTGNLDKPTDGEELEPILGGTTSRGDGQLDSEEPEAAPEIKPCTEGRGSRPLRSSTGRDDFSEIRIGGRKRMTESVDDQSAVTETSARMLAILQKRGFGRK